MNKVVLLVLALITGEDSYELVKIKYHTILSCSEIYEATVNFKTIDGKTYPIYKNRIAFAHYCLDEKGDYYLGYGQG